MERIYELPQELPVNDPVLLRCIVWAETDQERPAGSNLPDWANLDRLSEFVMADDRDEGLKYFSVVLAVKMQIDDVPWPAIYSDGE